MRVLMFGWEYPPFNSGGLGVACQGLARSLVNQGIELIFVLPKNHGTIKEPFQFIYADIPNVKLIEINSALMPYLTSEKYSHLKSEHAGWIYADTLYEEVARYAAVAKKIASSLNFDLVHAHDWLTFSAGVAAQNVSHKPFVAQVHATEVDRTGNIHQVNPRVYDLEKSGTEAANRVISVSNFTKQNLIHHYGIAGSKIDVIHNGVDADRYHLDTPLDDGLVSLKKLGYKIVLFLGRITLQKGVDYLVEAANRALKVDDKIVFVIVGSGDMEGKIMSQVASCGISDKFIFPGFLREEERSAVYKTADLFIMPSVSEPFGLTALESLLHNTPVIISKQSGVSEVIHHALKVDFWDIDEMADQILSALNYRSLNRTMAINGKREALMCSWDKAAEKCIKVYQSI